MILDVLLVLSSWGGLRCGGSLDVSQYILKEHRFIMEQLKCAFQSVLGEKPTKNQLQWYVVYVIVKIITYEINGIGVV